MKAIKTADGHTIPRSCAATEEQAWKQACVIYSHMMRCMEEGYRCVEVTITEAEQPDGNIMPLVNKLVEIGKDMPPIDAEQAMPVEVVPKHIAAHDFISNWRGDCSVCGDSWLDTRHRKSIQPHPACKGKNCGRTDGTHSAECHAEHDALHAAPPVPAGMVWQPIETAPKGKKVLAGYHNSYRNWCTITAHYYPAGTLQNNDDSDSADEYAPEGWYEECESNPDGNIYPVDCEPTHWMPLPAAPKGEI